MNDSSGLLRIWHVEVLSSVAANPGAVTFSRTSYCVAPARWESLAKDDLDRRVGVLLDAAYAKRNHEMAQTGDPTPTWLIAYDHEWVAADEMPASEPTHHAVMIATADIATALVESAISQIDDLRGLARPGRASNPWQQSFSAWSVDDDDSWRIPKRGERAAMFSSRLG